jgi:tetratricopeptide (TPR) repeat protein
MLLAIESGNFDDAEKWSQKSLELMDNRDPQRVCITYTGVGYYNLMRGNFSEAMRNLDKAKEIYDKNQFLGQYTVNLFCF